MYLEDDPQQHDGKTQMRKKLTVAATAIGACAAVLTPATYASAETAQETIDRLQSQGYTVTIDKIGTAPLAQCQVTSVRNPQSVTQLVPYIGPGRGTRDRAILIPQVTSQTISVSLDCSR
jgi:hypothetical protein